jgi:CRISPR-associated protein Csb2
MLVLEVEFTLGDYRGAESPFDTTTDWPPQPDRLFSALVSTWGTRGRKHEEALALRWLESQAPPEMRAGPHTERSTPGVYVPVNQATTTVELLPSRRLRQRRRFPTAVLQDSTLTYAWKDATPSQETFDQLEHLARDAAYLGKSTSPARFSFYRDAPEGFDDRPVVPTRRGVYIGRLDELERDFKAGKLTPPGVSLKPAPPAEPEPPRSVFGTKWILFYDSGGLRPNIRRVSTAAAALRRAILSAHFGRDALEELSGHRDGAYQEKSLKPHMAIFPLANVGWTYSDECLMGMALVLPRDTSREVEEALYRAVNYLRGHCVLPEKDESEIAVPLREANYWMLTRKAEPTQASLDPTRYLGRSRVWTTVTPIMLNYDPREVSFSERQKVMIAQLREACEHIGLPQPAQVKLCLNSAIRGCPSVMSWQNGRRPHLKESDHRPYEPWNKWNVPAKLAHKPLTHATLIWDTEVEGPVALGAARFGALGLCLPLKSE